MEITHLGVFLHIEGIVHITPNAEPHLIDGNHPVAGRPLEDMELNDAVLARRHNSELTQAHLEHHILAEEDLLPDHDEGPGS